MYKSLHQWAERYFLSPNILDILLAFLLYPLSLIYALIIRLKFILRHEISHDVAVISIGNLTLGGSGKTPLGIAILNEFSGGFVVLRGYKRKSKGLIIVAKHGEILVDVNLSGDEAMEYAKSVKNANVIVSENRDIAILKAKELGARYVLLDDGFGKFHIKKLNILIRPKIEPRFKFCIPAGAYRYPYSFYKYADFIACEELTHFRTSHIQNQTCKMVLVTAIANPSRLSEFVNICIAYEFYPDHYDFKRQELIEILEKHNATSILVTQKDLVKIEKFNLPTSVIKLKTTLSPEFKELIKTKIL